MEQYKDKKTGAIYTINDSSVLSYFDNNSNYEKVGEKSTKKKGASKVEKTTEEIETPENAEEVENTTPEAE